MPVTTFSISVFRARPLPVFHAGEAATPINNHAGSEAVTNVLFALQPLMSKPVAIYLREGLVTTGLFGPSGQPLSDELSGEWHGSQFVKVPLGEGEFALIASPAIAGATPTMHADLVSRADASVASDARSMEVLTSALRGLASARLI